MDLRALSEDVALRHLGLELEPGRRVIDGKTGLEGQIVSGALERVTAPTIPTPGASSTAVAPAVLSSETVQRYAVRLVGGELVSRRRSDLIALPKGLRADVEEFHP